MKRKTGSSRAPLYELYGEIGRDSALDGLHIESIAERSRLHNWEISSHRHGGLLQLLLMHDGQARVEIDARLIELAAPALVWVPALAVHGFRFSPETAGHVVTLDLAWLRKLLGGLQGAWAELSHARALQLAASQPPFTELLAALQTLAAEYAGTARWRAQAIEGLLLAISAHVARLPRLEPQPGQVSAETRAAQHLSRLRSQIEQHYRSQPSLAALVAPIGITPAQMNRICRRHLNCSALELLHQRLLLEAKRELGYTTLQVQQISDALGFADPAYFTRFFRRLTGCSPRQWRESRVPALAGHPSHR